MSGQVTYACNCLNVKIHLAKKYDLEGHEKYRDSQFDPATSGWHFQLGMSGVVVEFPSLVSERRASDCTVVSCLNCDSSDIYSVKHPIDNHQTDDQVTIYKGAIFGKDIIKLQGQGTYSDVFRVVLNPNLPVSQVSLDKVEADTTLDSYLQSQQQYVKRLLKKAIFTMEDATKKKIQAYQREQELLLAREREKANHEGAILWQSMKEISQAKQGRYKVNEGSSDQVIFSCNLSAGSSQDMFEMHNRESHVNDSVFDKECTQQRRRSSVFTRDMFGEFAPNLDHRRTSYALDESSVAHSFKRPVDKLPPFQRRSSLIPQNLHPLAAASTRKTETNMVLPRSSWDGEAHQEDMFALDEDMDESYVGRRKSSKYLELFDEENEIVNASGSKFATSHPPPAAAAAAVSVQNEKSQNRHVHPSSCLIEPTYYKESGRRPSFVGFDYAQVDRETSSQLPPLEMTTKRESSVTVTSNHVTSNNDNADTRNSRTDEGPMIPPHLFAANTVTDETEAIFGSVPRQSIRNRPIVD